MRLNYYKTMMKEDKTPYMVKEKAVNVPMENKIRTIADLERIVEYSEIGKETEEHVIMIGMTNSNKVIGICPISHGGVRCSVFDNRTIFTKALLMGAVRFALVHNHPSGDPTPSQQDLNATKEITSLCKMMGIDLLDHMIAGDYVVSMKGYYGHLWN